MTDLPLGLVGHDLGGTLRPHQEEGALFMVANERVLVGSQMGTGKTAQALAAVDHIGAFPAVVVCSASLGLNFLREAECWLPNANIGLVRPGRMRYDNYADVTIVSYDLLHKHLDHLPRPRAVVIDEAHYVKEPSARRSQAVARLCQGVPYLWPMTGTPVINRPAELIPILTIMRSLEEFGGWQHFTERYCDRRSIPCPACFGRGSVKNRRCRSCRGAKTVFDYSGTSNLPELNELLRRHRYIRDLRRDVLPEVPGQDPAQLVPVEITNRREYERAAKDLLSWLREFADEDAVMRAARAPGATRFAYLRQLVARGKVAPSVAWIGDFLDSTADDEKLVVFAHHHVLREPVAAAFPGCAEITGGNPDRADAEVQRFQKDPSVRLMVASIEAGGLGHTMTAAAHVAILELPTTPKAIDQAIARLDRLGQTERVRSYHLYADRTIDEQLARLIASKREIIDALVERGDDVAADALGDEDLTAELFGAITKQAKHDIVVFSGH